MAKKSIGATLALKNGNFFANAKSAVSQANGLKSALLSMTGGLKASGAQTNVLGNGLKSLTGKIIGVAAAAVSIRQIASFGKECIESANGQINAEARLERLMMNVKGTTAANVAEIKKYASTLQGVTTVGDEVAISGASQLATFQLQSSTIKTLLPAFEDLAVGQHGINVSQEQAISSANLLGKVMMGQTSALSRAGVTFSSAQAAILKTGTESQKAAVLVEVLGQNFGGLAEKMAQTPEGRIIQLKNAWSDVKEVIGAQLYPVVTNVLNWVATKVPLVQKMITGAVTAVKPAFDWFTTTALPAVDNAFGKIKKLSETAFSGVNTSTFREAFSAIISGVSGVASSTMNAVGPLLPGIMKTISGAAGLIAEILPPISSAVTAVIDALAPAMVVVVDIFSEIIKWVSPVISTIVSGVSRVITAAAPLITILVQRLQPAIKMVMAVIKGVLNVLKPILDTAFNHISLVISTITNLLNGDFGVAWQNIKAIISNAINGAKNIISAVLESVKIVFSAAWENIKTGVMTVWETIKTGIQEKATAIWTGITSTFENIKNGIVEKIQAAVDKVKNIFNTIKDTVKNVWEGIKGIIKAPHIVTEGTLKIAGIDTPIPKIGIKWYADGGIMKRPTMFGMSGNTAHIGGEAGAEAILPLSAFWRNLQAYTENSQKKSQGNNDININVTINAGNANEEEMAARFINIVVPEIKRQYAIL